MHLWILLMTVLPGADPTAEVGQPSTKRIIIHADDAGMSHSVNRGTIDAMEQGCVTSCSIMVPCPWFPEFAEYARANPQRDYGIHLTLNSEWKLYRWRPVANPSEVPSLTDEDGFLWDNVQQVAENARVEEAEIELRAQIERARKFGVPLTHLDTHMGSAFCRPDLARLYVKLSFEYQLPVLVVRPTEQNQLEKQYPEVLKLIAPLESAGMPILEEVYQTYDAGPYKKRKAKYIEILRTAPNGLSEIIIHCGYDNDELRSITSSVEIRDSDRRIFMDPEVIQVIKEEGIKLTTWREETPERSKTTRDSE